MDDHNKCCGLFCSTPHCPMCGKRQSLDTSLKGLLQFCVKTREAKRNNAEKYLKRADDPQNTANRNHFTELANSNADALRVWAFWTEGLVGLLSLEQQENDRLDF